MENKELTLLRKTIITELIEPSYYSDVKEMLEGRKCWRITSDVFTTLSKISVGFASVFSFASGTYQNQTFSFVAGSVSVISLILLQFSSYAAKESKEKTDGLNLILKKLSINDVPEIASNISNNNSVSHNDK